MSVGDRSPPTGSMHACAYREPPSHSVLPGDREPQHTREDAMDLHSFYVITSGPRPGIYHGRRRAAAAMQGHGPVNMALCGSKAQAGILFAELLMSGRVEVVPNQSRS